MDGVSAYIVIYSNALTGDECDSTYIPATSCINGICSDTFEVQDNCSSDVNVTVLADNLIPSEPIKIGIIILLCIILWL